MTAILRKELADYFTSIRFIILFAMMLGVSAVGLWAASQGIRNTNLPEGFIFLGLFTTPGMIPLFGSLPVLIALIVPLIGIALGFDAINSERTGGTLSRVLSQPIYRDSVINGKFLAGIVTLSIMVGTMILLISGYGLRMIGVPPTAEEIIRIFIYLVLTIVYGAFWLGLAILFSILFAHVATSALTSIGIWVFFFFYTMTGFIAGQAQDLQSAIMAMRVSPLFLFQESMSVILVPGARTISEMIQIATTSSARFIPGPLSLSQSLITIWPHLAIIGGLTAALFAGSYVKFMREEIRST